MKRIVKEFNKLDNINKLKSLNRKPCIYIDLPCIDDRLKKNDYKSSLSSDKSTVKVIQIDDENYISNSKIFGDKTHFRDSTEINQES